MSIERNTFCWYGISTDKTVGAGFYPSVLGWTLTDETSEHSVFIAPGGAVAHMQTTADAPPHWCTYLAVDDVDASTATAAREGGAVVLPPMDLPAGRFSLVATPSGAILALYQGVESDEMATPGPGTIHGIELQSMAPEADVAWFSAAFGMSCRPEGDGFVLAATGATRAVVTPSSSDRSVVLPWVQVADIEHASTQVRALNGRVLADAVSTPSNARRAVVADPSGAIFGLIELA